MQPTFSVARPRQISAVLKWEVSADFCRGTGTALAGAAFLLGTILAKAPTGELVPIDPTKSDGTEDFAAVALETVEAPADASLDDSDNRFLTLERGPAIVSASGLVWPAGISAPAQAAIAAAMLAAGIKISNA